MKKPQLEDGYIRIANELFLALCKYRFSGEERQLFDCVLIKTYGFNKKVERIPYSKFSELTGINRRNCMRAIKKLVSKRTLVVAKKGYYSINKDYDSWLSGVKIDTSKKWCQNRHQSGVKIDTRQIYKDTLLKTGRGIKTYFISLKEEDKQKIATDLKVSPETVDYYCEQADSWSNGKGNKMLSWYLTIRGWIQRDLKDGKIKRVLPVEDQLAIKAKELGLSINDYKRVEQ